MEKLNINNLSKIKDFCLNNNINFVQWASHPDRIYLTTIIKKGKCERKARIVFNDFEKDLKVLQNLTQSS